MFWNKKELTILEVINNELDRLHRELDTYTIDADELKPNDPYNLLLQEISKLNNQLIELSKLENRSTL